GAFVGPVISRPLPFLVRRIDAELENVALGQSQMLEKLPERMWMIRRAHAPRFLRHAVEHLLEAGVRVLPAEDTRHVLPKRAVVHRQLDGGRGSEDRSGTSR